MYTKSKLIEKQNISESSYNELFSYLNSHHPIHHLEYYELLRETLIGRISFGYTRLTTPDFGNDKCWFINSGMIIGFQKESSRKVAVLIFKAGEIAILPNSFFYDHSPFCWFMACPDTHLLEINSKDSQQRHHAFPEVRELSTKIGYSNLNNFMEKSELASLTGKEAILEFHARYPDTQGPSRKIKLLDAYQASYLTITPSTFSKLLKQIYPDDR